MAKILIVDDAAFMRMMIKDILTKNGYEVVAEAANGVEAVELYKSHQPDLVTMDITMPEMVGIEAVKQIKAVNYVFSNGATINGYGCYKGRSK